MPTGDQDEDQDDEDDDETLGALSTYKFFVDENQIGASKGVKLRGEVTFAEIFAKANLSESDYKEDDFEGWKIKETDRFAKDEDTFTANTDFVASYKVKMPYKESVNASDFTKGMWRTADKTKYIMFVEDPDGQHEVLQMSDMPYAKAEEIYNAYVALYTEYPEHPGQFEDTDGNWKNKYKKVGSSSAKTDEYEAAVKKITSKFDSAMWFPGDNWEPFAWNGANHITVFDFTSGIDLPALYVGNDGETLRDADGNIVLRLIFE